jgi:multicomponent Na+:H+ antiporter subunit D
VNAVDLLPLLVAVPLVGSLVPFAVSSARPALARAATGALLAAQVVLAAVVVAVVGAGGPLTYVVGDLPAAVGIGLLVDRVSALFVLLVAVAGAGFALVRVEPTGPSDSLWLLLVAGLTGVCITADVFNLYVFLEISGLAAYALVATRRDATAALAALQYLLVGTVGATFYLLGVGYLYVAAGTLAMADLRVELASVGYDSTLVVAAFALVVVGLSVKVALYPLHVWKPDAYAAAPSDVAALLATLGSTVAGYALVRITFGVFTEGFLSAVPLARTALLTVGVVGVLAGAYLTLRQSDVRRLLSYSSVLQFGLVVVAVGVATTGSVTAALVLLLANAVAKGGLFVATGVLARDGATTVADYAGRARERPALAAAVAVAFASLVGLPPSVGFAGKWYLALSAVDGGRWLVASVVLASTLLSLAYAGRVVERLYVSPESPDRAGAPVTDGGTAAETRAVVVVVAAAATTVALGLGSTAVADWVAPVVEGWL